MALISTFEGGEPQQSDTDVLTPSIAVWSRELNADVVKKHQPRLVGGYASELESGLRWSKPNLQRAVACHQRRCTVVPDLQLAQHRVPVHADVRVDGVAQRPGRFDPVPRKKRIGDRRTAPVAGVVDGRADSDEEIDEVDVQQRVDGERVILDGTVVRRKDADTQLRQQSQQRVGTY